MTGTPRLIAMPSTQTQPESRVFLDSSVVMAQLGYNRPGSFFAMCRAEGLPFIRINSRKFLFDQDQVNAWLKARTFGETKKHA